MAPIGAIPPVRSNWKVIEPEVDAKRRSRWDAPIIQNGTSSTTPTSTTSSATTRLRSRSPVHSPLLNGNPLHSSQYSSHATNHQSTVPSYSSTYQSNPAASIASSSIVSSSIPRVSRFDKTVPTHFPPTTSTFAPVPPDPSLSRPTPRPHRPEGARDYKVEYDPATDPSSAKKGKEIVYRFNGEGVGEVKDPRNATSQARKEREKALRPRIEAGKRLTILSYNVSFDFYPVVLRWTQV